MEPTLFEDVADILRGVVPRELGELCCRAQRYGVKVWFDSVEPPREHYEAQVLGARHVPAATTLAVEIGFHAEHREPAKNEAAVAGLAKAAARLGKPAEVGAFLGKDTWRRISETWPDPDLRGADVCIEIAVRLGEYITTLEPARRKLART